jgi:alpha/beta superfamily hydrolase
VPDVVHLAPQVPCPTLFIRGDQEPREIYPAEDFQARCGGPCTVEIVPDCNHFYTGREEAVAAAVCGWLGRTLKLEG